MPLWNPFRPDNALVLAYDHIAPDGREELEAQIDEVGRYYRFVTLSQLVRRRRGVAAVVFAEARKSLFQHAVPSLRGRKIPFTVFVHADCVGLTRLPLDEELAEYGDDGGRAWLDPVWGEARLGALRRERGPLPFDKLDPMRFSVVWRQFLDIPPPLLDFGLRLPAAPFSSNRDRIREAKDFIESQVRRPVTLAAIPYEVPDSSIKEAEETLHALGLSACLRPRFGYIDDKTPALELPRWRFEQNER